MSRAPVSPAAADVFHTQPSDTALVKEYLRPWVVWSEFDRSGVGAYMHADDMYEAAPEDLTRVFAPVISEDGQRCWYFLTPVRPKSTKPDGRKRSRTAGGGVWHGEGRIKRVVDLHNRLIGKRSSFTFKLNNVATGWIMSEYRLDNEDGEPLPELAKDIMLGKVYRSPRRRDPPAETAANAARHLNAGAPEGGCHDDPAAEPDVRAASSRGKRKADAEHRAGREVVHTAEEDEDPSPRKKWRAAEAPAAVDLQCPRCAFRLGALHAVVTPAKGNSGTDAGTAKGIPRVQDSPST